MKKYRPSSGTEGMSFTEKYCEQCIHERWMHFQDEDREEDKTTCYAFYERNNRKNINRGRGFG